MATHKKLDTFVLSDQFGWNRQEILVEANEMATQHAAMMGWTDIEVKDITSIPTDDGNAVCYKFEIWGVGIPSTQLDTEQPSKVTVDQSQGRAAKQPEL